MIARIQGKDGYVVFIATSEQEITEQQINRLKFVAQKEFGGFVIERGKNHAEAKAKAPEGAKE